MKNLFILLLALLLSVPSYSQKDETILRNPRLQMTGLWAGSSALVNNFHTDNYFSHGSFFNFEFNKNYLIGWDNYKSNGFDENVGDFKIQTNHLMLGYTYNGFQVIHPAAFVSIGRAKSKTDDLAVVRSFSGQAGIGAEVNIFRWFRIGAELGYRYVDDRDHEWIRDAGMSTPYAGIKLKFGWSWGK
jgi:hypothetical protein